MYENEIFDNWNSQKKYLDKNGKARFYREKEVWWISLGKNIGSEQDGKGSSYERPVLIIKAFNKSVCLVIPLTTSNKINPFYINVGIVNGKSASVIISQLRLIDTKRLINRICILNPVIFSVIRKTVRNLF